MAREALTDDWEEVATNVTAYSIQNVGREMVLVTTVATGGAAPTGTTGFQIYSDALLERSYAAGVDVYARAASRKGEIEIEAS